MHIMPSIERHTAGVDATSDMAPRDARAAQICEGALSAYGRDRPWQVEEGHGGRRAARRPGAAVERWSGAPRLGVEAGQDAGTQ